MAQTRLDNCPSTMRLSRVTGGSQRREWRATCLQSTGPISGAYWGQGTVFCGRTYLFIDSRALQEKKKVVGLERGPLSLVSTIDRLCGLVVKVPGYRSSGPGWIPEHYKKKKVVGLERGPLSLVSTTEEILGRNNSGSGLEVREYGRRDSSRWPSGILYPQKVGTNFADPLGLYSSLADWGHGVFFCISLRDRMRRFGLDWSFSA
jgi:hypothetical protein